MSKDLQPLSTLLRPNSLDWFVWQKHLVGENKPLKEFIESWKIPSMIFWWPPWVGKTSLALIIATKLKADFFHMSWVHSKKADLEWIISHADMNYKVWRPTLVFLDEIHRWNKAQQDTLLPFVELWKIVLIWATTENPSFTVNNALLSRSRVFVFEKITDQDIYEFFVKNKFKIIEKYPDIQLNDDIFILISHLSNWDLRWWLNLLETAIMLRKKWLITKEDISNASDNQIFYDRDWEEHYNIISAVHKSLRDSDVDASCYWIQRMLSAGEDPLYIVRRLMRFASEDIGIANNNALLLANQVYDAVHKIGMPECNVFIFHLAIYLAQSPKSNKAYVIAQQTAQDVKKFGNLPVPKHIRNAPTKLMKDLWYGKWYKYAHDYKDTNVDQEHFPPELKGRKYG